MSTIHLEVDLATYQNIVKLLQRQEQDRIKARERAQKRRDAEKLAAVNNPSLILPIQPMNTMIFRVLNS